VCCHPVNWSDALLKLLAVANSSSVTGGSGGGGGGGGGKEKEEAEQMHVDRGSVWESSCLIDFGPGGGTGAMTL
jgi:hypothetical protein